MKNRQGMKDELRELLWGTLDSKEEVVTLKEIEDIGYTNGGARHVLVELRREIGVGGKFQLVTEYRYTSETRTVYRIESR